ncbi:MAG: GNAT family N-acetyltransferase [Pseudomonadota bacterium]
MSFAAYPLTPDRWDGLVDVFGGGDGKGACGKCWCMWWRVPRQGLGATLGSDVKARFQARVDAGPPPGLLGYDNGVPVGWVQVGPRSDVPEWSAARRLTAPLTREEADDPAVWGVSCFVIRVGHRRKGYASALLEASVSYARRGGARLLDACPVEAKPKASAGSLFHGPAAIFVRAGFEEVARRKANRPLMRMVLKA